MPSKTAVIIGGGPAGLTAAYELLKRSDVTPIVLEKDVILGGIARTVNYKGNRIDLGGHRFFSKSDRVMNWWLNLMPVERSAATGATITYQRQSRDLAVESEGPDATETDDVMLLRSRQSRVYYLRKFFDYPITLSVGTIRNLGLARMIRIGLSYLKARLAPIRDEQNLEQFFINRFGRELYGTFFESYTEKVWGVPCREISAAWGAQRIKGLSIIGAVKHALNRPFKKRDMAQKGTETSLIEQFLYPKYGPGQMWEICAARIKEMGGKVIMSQEVDRIEFEGATATGVSMRDPHTGETTTMAADYVFSTMPVTELIDALATDVPANVREVRDGLVYRDFLTVGLLVDDLVVHEDGAGAKLLRDNWIYIQEPDVLVGRLQIFNNWSPYMVADPSKVWIGLEYFCNEGDHIWSRSDDDLLELGRNELHKIGIIDRDAVLDGTVLRMPKTYPAYFGAHDRFDEIREFLDPIENLFLIGRNGMHRYNNQDHSMLAAMTAVDNIIAGRVDKMNIWDVNTEDEYHEEK